MGSKDVHTPLFVTLCVAICVWLGKRMMMVVWCVWCVIHAEYSRNWNTSRAAAVKHVSQKHPDAQYPRRQNPLLFLADPGNGILQATSQSWMDDRLPDFAALYATKLERKVKNDPVPYLHTRNLKLLIVEAKSSIVSEADEMSPTKSRLEWKGQDGVVPRKSFNQFWESEPSRCGKWKMHLFESVMRREGIGSLLPRPDCGHFSFPLSFFHNHKEDDTLSRVHDVCSWCHLLRTQLIEFTRREESGEKRGTGPGRLMIRH